MSEAIDISSGSLDSSLCFIQSGISHDILYQLNKQGDNIEPWCTPFPIRNQSVIPCPVLIVASWPAYRFLMRQIRCSGIPISFRIFHSLLGSIQYILIGSNHTTYRIRKKNIYILSSYFPQDWIIFHLVLYFFLLILYLFFHISGLPYFYEVFGWL